MKELVINKDANKKMFHATLKVADNKARKIIGKASTTFEDRDREVITKDAIEIAFDNFMLGQNTPILRGHDMNRPIGKVLGGYVDEGGLTIEAEIATGTRDADETWALIEQGVMKAFSIGFIRGETDWSSTPAIIKELELFEVSVVSIPSNRQSLFSVAKALKSGTDLIEDEKLETGFNARWKSFCKDIEFFTLLYEQDNLTPSQKLALDGFAKSLHSVGERDEKSMFLSAQKQLDGLYEEVRVLKKQIELTELERDEAKLLVSGS